MVDLYDATVCPEGMGSGWVLALERSDGWRLADLQEKWSPSRLAALGAEICGAMAAASRAGHGPLAVAADLVVVRPDGRILLAGSGPDGTPEEGSALADLLAGLGGDGRRFRPLRSLLQQMRVAVSDGAGMEYWEAALRGQAGTARVGPVTSPRAGRVRRPAGLWLKILLAVLVGAGLFFGGLQLLTSRSAGGAVPAAESRRSAAWARFAEGRAALARGDLPAARSSLELALHLEPTLGAAHVELAVLHVRRGRPDLARVHLDTARASGALPSSVPQRAELEDLLR